MSRLGTTRTREIVFLVVGASTPVGILAVNASAFVMHHLGQFQIGIALCALISGLSLNGLTSWVLLGRAERYAPQLFAEYRFWLVAAVVIFVALFSVLGAYGAFQSMSDARTLPNIYAVLTALWLLVLPVLMTFIGRRLKLGTTRTAGIEKGPPPRRRAFID
jgi:hypothetical protein